ncbi:MAG: hypothetical protein Kow0042_01640 [Calditrichia bacterium]
MFRLLAFLFCCLPVAILFWGIPPDLPAQTGSWVAQAIDPSMSGAYRYECGETVAAMSWQTTRFLYGFDINSGQWHTLDLGALQTVHALQARGNVAMAYTDTLIAAYSAFTSQWDTLFYRGTLLPYPSWSDHSWGCGENLAWFVTDSVAYIFDGELGQWRSQPYIMPFNYISGSGRFWSRGDYAGIILFDQVANQYFNIAYSLVQHDFSLLPNGGYYDDASWEMDHGYVARWDNGVEYRMIGYSANTNSFDIETTILPPSGPTLWVDIQNVLERTVYAFSYKEPVNPPQYRLNSFGFDTRHGSWTIDTLTYDINEWSFDGWSCGGQIAMRRLQNTAGNNAYTYLIFNGESNYFLRESPGLRWDGVSYGSKLGGRVVVDFDTSTIWIHSNNSIFSSITSYSGEDVNTTCLGESYVVVDNQINNLPDNHRVYYYSAGNSSPTTLTIPRMRGSFRSTPWMCSFATYGLNNEVFFYSALRDEHLLVNFPGTVQSSQINVEGTLAVVKQSGFLCLYDAATNQAFTVGENFSASPQLGDYVAMMKKDYTTVSAYSGLIGQWFDFVISDGAGWADAGDYVGLIESTAGDDEFYAFNGYSGDLIMLVPGGNPISGINPKIGGKTILVVRDTVIYAFTPDIATPLPGQSPLPAAETIRLFPNYPNPFNPCTTLEYQLPVGGKGSLIIYDLLGRKIKTLFRGMQPAGTHRVTWDGTNDRGRSVPSGIYFALLKFNHKTKRSRKMILIR